MDLPGQYQMLSHQMERTVKEVLASGRYILGPYVQKFEKEFAHFCQAKYCVGTSSGTSALYLSLLSLGIGPGDEVITVPNTFTATAESIVLVGAKVVFCDVDAQTFNMDIDSLKSKITPKTRAIIPVHLHGNPAEMDQIWQIAQKYHLKVIEDAAQAHGAKFKNKPIGSGYSDLVAFSFHPVKNLGAFGDGGAVVTNNSKLAKDLTLLVNHGRANHHLHIKIGTTSRLDALQAAILSLKLKYLPQFLAQKIKLVNYYRQNLTKKVSFPQITRQSASAHHVAVILSTKRNNLAQFLTQNGIEVGLHYPIPLHLQPAYKFLGYEKGDFPIAEMYADQTLSLPLYPHMTKKTVNYVITKVNKFYA